MTLRLGLGISNARESKVYPPGFTSPTTLRVLAQAAESAGFWSLWLNDLLLTHDDARAVSPTPPNFYEVHATAAYLSAITSRIRLLSAAVTLPLRDPMILAKEAATLDQLSGGRYLLGLGLGGNRSEFERLRGRFAAKLNRGRMLDEGLDLLHRALTDAIVSFEGEYFSVSNAEMFPKPVQNPYPIYITGGGEEMLKRTARWGRGWIHMNVSPEETAALVRQLQTEMDATGRDAREVDVSLLFDISVARTHELAIERWEASPGMAISRSRGRGTPSSVMIGTPDEVGERLERYASAGATHIGLLAAGNSPDEVLAQVSLLGEQVIPRLGAVAA